MKKANTKIIPEESKKENIIEKLEKPVTAKKMKLNNGQSVQRQVIPQQNDKI